MIVTKQHFFDILDPALVPTFRRSAGVYRREVGLFGQLIKPRWVSIGSQTGQCDIEVSFFLLDSCAPPDFLFKAGRVDETVESHWQPFRHQSWEAFETFARQDAQRLRNMMDRLLDPTEFMKYYEFLIPDYRWIFEVDFALATNNQADALALWKRRNTHDKSDFYENNLPRAAALYNLSRFLNIDDNDEWAVDATRGIEQLKKTKGRIQKFYLEQQAELESHLAETP